MAKALSSLFAVAVVALTLTATRSAHAQEGIRLQVNWLTFAESYRALTADASKGTRSDAASLARVVEMEESPWLGGGFIVSLVARDGKARRASPAGRSR